MNRAARVLVAKPGVAGMVSGFLLYLAHPGVGLWPLSFIAFVPLVLALQVSSFQRALLEGAVAGLCLYVPGFAWAPASLQGYFSLRWTAALALSGALVLLSSLKLCAGAALARALMAQRVPVALAAACAFAAGEVMVPELVPYTVSAAFYRAPAFLQVAEWGGAPLVVALVSGTNVLLASVASSASLGAALRHVGGASAVVLCWFAVGACRREVVAARAAEAPAFRVLLVDPGIAPDLKRKAPGDVVRRYRSLTAEAMIREPADFAVWAEAAFAVPLDERRLSELLSLRTRGGPGIPLVAGAVITRDAASSYNSAVSMDAGAKVCAQCRYDKQRLVPVAEELPWKRDAMGAARSQFGSFEAGPRSGAMLIQGHSALVAICYEAMFAGALRRRSADLEPEVLVSLASNGWLRSDAASRVHLALVQLRAIEHGKFLIHSTTGAQSAVIAPHGFIDALPNKRVPQARVFSGRWLEGKTLWIRTGNVPFCVAVASIGVYAWLRARRRAL